MLLYRGIKANTYKHYNKDQDKKSRKDILNIREQTKEYPTKLNTEIIHLHKNSKLQTQIFSDKESIAKTYAQKNNGILISIDVPIDDITKYFDLEIQNYPQRKKQFELVYTIDAHILQKHEQKRNIKIQKL